MKNKLKKISKSFLMLLLLGALICSASGLTALADVSIVTSVVTNNAAPIAENLSVETFQNILVCSAFQAVDPEGDAITFELRCEPKKGTVTVYEDGTFSYAPLENKKGKDSFTYVAIDNGGNVSNEATVTVNIKKQKIALSYADMTDNPAHYAALLLAENKIYLGENLGNQYFFRPDTLVSRSEFLALCLETCHVDCLDSIATTGFADDETIPVWAKSYAASALMSNIISGCLTAEGAYVFMANEPISYAEAAVILNNSLSISDVHGNTLDDDIAPTWAYQATSNLVACDVIQQNTFNASAKLTRAEAAQMMAEALRIQDAREVPSSLLRWAQ